MPEDNKSPEERSADDEIEEFNEYFQKALNNDPLIKSEVAILKTFLYWQKNKTHIV